MTVREYTAPEPITAVIHLELPTGEAYWEPIVIGHYGAAGAGEIWIEHEGKRIGIPKDHAASIMKQLRRAMKIADEASED